MRAFLQFLSVPVAAICLVIVLGMVGGIERGTVPFPIGLAVTVVAMLVELAVIKIFWDKEETEDEEDPDE